MREQPFLHLKQISNQQLDRSKQVENQYFKNAPSGQISFDGAGHLDVIEKQFMEPLVKSWTLLS
jgi:hypothetical protein